MRHACSVLGILAVLVLLAPAASHAQAPGESGYWKTQVASQINTLIKSNNPALRERGLELVIELQNRDVAARFDLASTRSQLYSVFFDRRNTDAQRILALSALYATGSVSTSETLATWGEEEPSDRVRRQVQLALNQGG